MAFFVAEGAGNEKRRAQGLKVRNANDEGIT
jgi:hypothetical protein